MNDDFFFFFFFSSRRRHTRLTCDWSSDVCSSDLESCSGTRQRSESPVSGPPTRSAARRRSEERRVGKECRSRWSPYHSKKKHRLRTALRRRPRPPSARRRTAPQPHEARGCGRASQTALVLLFFFSSRRRHTRLTCDWSSDVCSSDLQRLLALGTPRRFRRPRSRAV